MGALHILKINNTKEAAIKSGKWKNPGAKFYNKLLDSFYCEGDIPTDSNTIDKYIKEGKYLLWNDFIKEAYLIAPIKNIKNSPYGVTSFSRSGCKYPHHEIRNGELVLSIPGVRAAYARAKQQGVYKGELKAHLERHIKELGELVNFEEKIEENFNDIYQYINERTGISLFDDITQDFMERSHGKLKYAYRSAYDTDTGHALKLIYSLNDTEITNTGRTLKSNQSDEEKQTEIIDTQKNIKKTGHLDHQSRALLLAIVDRVTGENLKEADVVGLYAPGIKGTYLDMHDAYGKNYKYNKDNPINKKYVQHIKVGEMEKDPSFKSTHWFKGDTKIGPNGKIFDNTMNRIAQAEQLNKARGAKLNDFKAPIISIGHKPIKYNHPSKKDIKKNPDLYNKESFNDIEDIKSLIQESFNWIENFVDNPDCRDQYLSENNYQVMMSRTNPNELMTWMKGNIRYGWRSSEDGKVYGSEEGNVIEFSNHYRLQSPNQLAENKVGIAWDQAELERQWFSKNGIEHGVFYIELQGNNSSPNHTFLVYHQNDYYWWFEHAWGSMQGIRRYDDLRSLILDVVINHQKVCNDNTSLVYVSWLQNPPSYNITCQEYINYAHSQKQLDVNNLPKDFYSNINESYFNEAEENQEETTDDEPPSLPGEEEISTEEESIEEEQPTSEEPPELEAPPSEESPIEDQPVEEPSVEEVPQEEVKEEPIKEEKPKQESLPKQTDRAESDKNGVRRKKLYIAFIEWCKEYNPKNTFGSIFDKDAFNVSYPFVPHEMRYFYRLANPMLCVLAGDLTFFPVAELRKLNANNSKLDEILIFAATPNDLRVFNSKDKKVYRATEENGSIDLAEVLGDTYDTYIQKMINKGDILNGPIEESVEFSNIW